MGRHSNTVKICKRVAKRKKPKVTNHGVARATCTKKGMYKVHSVIRDGVVKRKSYCRNRPRKRTAGGSPVV